MQFDLISDLHIDRWPPGQQIDWSLHKTHPVCVVAGDISDDLDDVVAELRRLRGVYDRVLYVDGNHESYDGLKNLKAAREKVRAAVAQVEGVTFLRDETYIADGVAVIGANGWWDFALGEPKVPAKVSRDAFATAKGLDAAALDGIVKTAKADYRHIMSEVDRLQDDHTIDGILVVTHTLPDPAFISWGTYPPRAELAGCYGSSRMPNIRNMDRNQKIKLWVFGHNHDSREQSIGHIRYLSHPRGRPKDFNRLDYTPRALSVFPEAEWAAIGSGGARLKQDPSQKLPPAARNQPSVPRPGMGQF